MGDTWRSSYSQLWDEEAQQARDSVQCPFCCEHAGRPCVARSSGREAKTHAQRVYLWRRRRVDDTSAPAQPEDGGRDA